MQELVDEIVEQLNSYDSVLTFIFLDALKNDDVKRLRELQRKIIDEFHRPAHNFNRVVKDLDNLIFERYKV